MGQTLSAYDAALKEFYEDYISEEVNQRTTMLDLFKKETDAPIDAGGRRVVYPAHISRNEGVGSVGEGANIPDAGNQGYADWVIPFKYTYGRIQLTAQVIKQSLKDKGAFKRALSSEIEGLVRDFRRDRNRSLCYWGDGILARVNGAHTAPTTVECKLPGGVALAQSGLTSATRAANKFLRSNMIVGFVSGAGAFIESESISSVASDMTDITLAAALSNNLSDGDFIVRASKTSSSAIADTGYQREVMGILGMVDDGTFVTTYHGLSRDTYPILESYVSALGAPLDLDSIQLLVDSVYEKGDGEINCFISSLIVRRAYLGLLETYRRYVNDGAKSPDGGFKGMALSKDITYGDTKWKVERDFPFGILVGVDTEGMKRFVVTEGEWADDDGSVLMRTTDKDVYEGRYRQFDNFHHEAPNRCGRLEDIRTAAPPLIPAY